MSEEDKQSQGNLQITNKLGSQNEQVQHTPHVDFESSKSSREASPGRLSLTRSATFTHKRLPYQQQNKLYSLEELLNVFNLELHNERYFNYNGESYEVCFSTFPAKVTKRCSDPIGQHSQYLLRRLSQIESSNDGDEDDSDPSDKTEELEANIEKIERLEVEIENKEQEINKVQDTFYEDIARRLAMEIELEEANETQSQEVTIQKSPMTQGKHKTQSQKILTVKNNRLQGKQVKEKKSLKVQSQTNSQEEFILKMNQINSEKEKLMEEVIMYKQRVKSMEEAFIGSVSSPLENQLHLAFLFASPLVLRSQVGITLSGKTSFEKIPLLEFTREFHEITESIKETQRRLRIRQKQATIENLTQILTQNPMALHFSGHGLENNQETFGRYAKQRYSDGNYLLFETVDGEGELVSERMLQEFIQSSNTNLEFVFVASCYSEFAGKIFYNAGAKHVIYVKQGQQIADLAVITFSKSFYHSVFNQSMTICDSFKMAMNQVEVKYGKGEARKFGIMISNNNSKHSKSLSSNFYSKLGMPDIDQEDLQHLSTDNHQCKIFGPLKKGSMENLEQKPRFREIPAKVDGFIGRQHELFEIVHNVYHNRLVTVIGLPGIGKTALSKNAVHYMAERSLFKLGFVFMQLKGYMNCDLFIKKLVLNFIKHNFDLDAQKLKEFTECSAEQLFIKALIFLKGQDQSLLIVFDNVEDLLYYDKQMFRNLINELLMTCSQVHVLLSSRTILGALQDISEKIIILKELSPFQTVELFMSRSREISKDEINELLTCEPENKLLVSDPQKQGGQIKNLTEHHLFKILSGNPHAIILAAPILIKMTLKDLYLLLNSKEMHDVLKVDGIKDQTVASLRLSLEASLKFLSQEDSQSLRFFFLIGMLPGGVYEYELGKIWGIDWNKHVEKLRNLSLISMKEIPNAQSKLILPPFMNNYAEAKISPEDKTEFQTDLCHYYAKICMKIFAINNRTRKDSQKQNEMNHRLNEKLLQHETNIWACIYRMVDLPPIDHNNQYSSHSLKKDMDKGAAKKHKSTFIQPASRKKISFDAKVENLIDPKEETKEPQTNKTTNRHTQREQSSFNFLNLYHDIKDMFGIFGGGTGTRNESQQSPAKA